MGEILCDIDNLVYENERTLKSSTSSRQSRRKPQRQFDSSHISLTGSPVIRRVIPSISKLMLGNFFSRSLIHQSKVSGERALRGTQEAGDSGCVTQTWCF